MIAVLGARVRRRHARELACFCAVGAAGYVVNLVVFAAAMRAGAGHLGAAAGAFLVAVTSNFMLNRRWTFRGAGHGALSAQAGRYLLVSVAAFVAGLGFLELLVGVGVSAFVAQALAIVLATPVTFLGQKLWSFRTRAVVPVGAR